MNTSLKNIGWGLKLGHTGRSKISGEYVIEKNVGWGVMCAHEV